MADQAARPAGIEIRIEASGLPGRDWLPDGQAGAQDGGQRNIYVGVQSRTDPPELLSLHPGDAPSAEWTIHATAVDAASGIDVKGPYIHGRPGSRFIYLAWISVIDPKPYAMFRRAKLMLDAVEPAVLDAARRNGRLTARLTLTDTKGGPLCAAVRPPLITWSA